MHNLSEDGLCHLKGKILPSMKKSTSYTAFITFSDGKILRAKCGCPAGIEGHCNHVSSMLFFLKNSVNIMQKLQLAHPSHVLGTNLAGKEK